MIDAILSANWSTTLAHVPNYGFAIVSAPIVSFLGIKILLLAKTASSQKNRREWVFTQDRDENGQPVLATVKSRRVYRNR